MGYSSINADATPPIMTASMYATSAIGTNSVIITQANWQRKALYLYNNSANTVYISFSTSANSNTNMTLPITTFTTWTMLTPIYCGPISGIRNAGTGTVLVTELI